MEIPHWYKLLTHFDKKRYFSNGLTIPFLIGSNTILNPKEELSSIDAILRQASSSTLPKPITIIRCGQIREYVIGILDGETAAIRKQHKSLYKEIDNLIFPDSSLNKIDNIDSLIIEFSTLYQPIIQNGFYSKNAGVWGDFLPEEKDRIKEII